MLGMLPLLVSSQEQSLGGGTVQVAVGASGALGARRPLAGGVGVAVGLAGAIQARRPLAGLVAIHIAAGGALVTRRPLGGGTVAIVVTASGGVFLLMPGRAVAVTRAALLAMPSQVP